MTKINVVGVIITVYYLPVYYYVYYLQYWDNNYNIASFNRLLMDYDISLVDWHTNVLQHCFYYRSCKYLQVGLMKFNVKKSKNTKVCDMVKLQFKW